MLNQSISLWLLSIKFIASLFSKFTKSNFLLSYKTLEHSFLFLFLVVFVLVSSTTFVLGSSTIGKHSSANIISHGIYTLESEIHSVGDNTWHVQFIYKNSSESKTLDLYVGNDHKFISRNTGSPLEFRKSFDEDFLAYTRKSLGDAPLPVTDEEFLLRAIQSIVFYVNEDLTTGSDEAVTQMKKEKNKFTFCGDCCFRTAGGNNISGGIGWQTCYTIDTKGSLDPRKWEITKSSQPCSGAQHCIGGRVIKR